MRGQFIPPGKTTVRTYMTTAREPSIYIFQFHKSFYCSHNKFLLSIIFFCLAPILLVGWQIVAVANLICSTWIWVQRSSLHLSISLSFCSFLYSGVCLDILKLSVSDITVSQKGSNGDSELHFFGHDYDFTRSLCAKIHLFFNTT